MTNSSQSRFSLSVTGVQHLSCVSGLCRESVRAEAGYDEANLFVGDFGWERFLEGLQAVHSQLLAGGGDLVVAFGGQPVGLKFGVASFDQVGDKGDDSAQSSLANLSNLNKRAPLFQQLEGLLGRARWFCPPTFIRAFPLPEILNRLEDLLPVHLNLLIAEAGHAPQLLQIRRFHEAQVLQSGIVQDKERGNSLTLRDVPPPLAQKLIQLSIDRRFRDRAGDPRLRLPRSVSISSQSGVAAQASQLPQVSHLGFSPKCKQTWRWRHSLDCTKRSTSW